MTLGDADISRVREFCARLGSHDQQVEETVFVVACQPSKEAACPIGVGVHRALAEAGSLQSPLELTQLFLQLLVRPRLFSQGGLRSPFSTWSMPKLERAQHRDDARGPCRAAAYITNMRRLWCAPQLGWHPLLLDQKRHRLSGLLRATRPAACGSPPPRVRPGRRCPDRARLAPRARRPPRGHGRAWRGSSDRQHSQLLMAGYGRQLGAMALGWRGCRWTQLVRRAGSRRLFRPGCRRA